MKDEEKYEYCAGLSLVDQIFFYILICIILLCIFFFYDIHASLSFILFIIAITAVFSVFFMWKDRRPYNHIPKIKYTGLDAWLDLFFVLVIVFFIRSYILSPFQIIWPSMESTFQGGKITYTAWWQKYSDGEFILVDKMTYRLSRPKRGDVIVFTPWIGPEKRFLIKRVIGLPGDTVKIENGYVSIATKDNPEKFVLINESQYLEKKFGYTCLVYNNTGCEKESQTFLVPAWKYFLLGDNRPQSLDSRKCFSNSGCTGEYILAQFVPISHIQWRVVYSLWHFDIFSQILPYPKIGTWQSVVPYRGLGIQNTHHYPELSQ
jgi:signal peptidase I